MSIEHHFEYDSAYVQMNCAIKADWLIDSGRKWLNPDFRMMNHSTLNMTGVNGWEPVETLSVRLNRYRHEEEEKLEKAVYKELKKAKLTLIELDKLKEKIESDFVRPLNLGSLNGTRYQSKKYYEECRRLRSLASEIAKTIDEYKKRFCDIKKQFDEFRNREE